MNNPILQLIIILLFFSSITSCNNSTIFTKEEINIIEQDSSQIMKVYKINNPLDSLTLRMKSEELSDKEILSDYYKLLSYKMIKTVSDTAVNGVGIAGPQIGINRRIIAVQRFDKLKKPFEVFANIYIKEYSKDTTLKSEGCLSVPDAKGKVERSQWIIISHKNTETLKIQEDTIKGFTSVIFQHEIDHLEGIIYTDRIYK